MVPVVSTAEIRAEWCVFIVSTADISPIIGSQFPVLKCWSLLSPEGGNLTCEVCRVYWPHWWGAYWHIKVHDGDLEWNINNSRTVNSPWDWSPWSLRIENEVWLPSQSVSLSHGLILHFVSLKPDYDSSPCSHWWICSWMCLVSGFILRYWTKLTHQGLQTLLWSMYCGSGKPERGQ